MKKRQVSVPNILQTFSHLEVRLLNNAKLVYRYLSGENITINFA